MSWEPAVKALNQLELGGETLRHALNVLATVAPEWLTPRVKPEGFERSAERIEDSRLPKEKTERDALSATIGEDGSTLLAGINQAAAQPEWAWLKELPAVRILEQTWAQQYRQVGGHAQRLTLSASRSAPHAQRLTPKEMAPVSASGTARPTTRRSGTAAHATSTGSVTRCI
jgi:hypothetical protein